MLARLAAVALALGLAFGLGLRAAIRERAYRPAAFVAFAPLLSHLVYQSWMLAAHGIGTAWLLTFVTAGLVVGLLGFFLARRASRGPRTLLALAPPAMALAYALPMALAQGAIARREGTLDPLPAFAFIMASIFLGAALLVYLPQGRRLGPLGRGRRGPNG